MSLKVKRNYVKVVFSKLDFEKNSIHLVILTFPAGGVSNVLEERKVDL